MTSSPTTRLPSGPPGRGRQRLVDFLRQWPWIYPRGIEPSAQDWIERARRRRGWYGGLRGEWREVLQPDGTVVHEPPANLPGAARAQFHLVASRRYPEASVCFLSGAHLVGNEGLVLTPDNRVLAEYYHQFGTRPLPRTILHQPFGLTRRRVDRLDDVIALLAAPQGWNYYHWLFDVLPRWHLLERWRNVIERYALPANLTAAQRESLTLLGISAEKTLALVPDGRWRCQHLYVPSLPGSEGCYPPWSLRFLRDTFLPAAAGVAGLGEKIYIRRTPGSPRPVLNEAELAASLARRGFQAVALESLSFVQQVAAFRDARIVVAAHGAGLANLVFAPAGTAVLELFSTDYLRPDCYFTLTRRLGQAYDIWLDENSHRAAGAWGAIAADVAAIERQLDQWPPR